MESTPTKYKAAGTPAELKIYRAELCIALEKRGVAISTFMQANDETSFPVSKRSLYDHVSSIKSGVEPLSAEKKSGRPGLLKGEEWDVICGAILTAEEKCDMAWIREFAAANFDVELSDSLISQHLNDRRLTLQLVGSRPMPKGMRREQYVLQYYEFLLKIHRDSFFSGDPRMTICADSTTNSYRLERVRTYNIRGGKQKKFMQAKPVYTNSFFKVVALEDSCEYPCLMFTYDPTFDPDGPRAKEVLEWCKLWKIDRSSIVFKKSAQVYWAESSDQIGHFMRVHSRKLRGTRVLHDAGNAFKKDRDYILADGAGAHFVFPPAPHGELSVLDNKVFGIAKKWWRTERVKHCGEDFSKQAFYLMCCVDRVTPAQIKACWDHNFLLDVPKLSMQLVDDRLKASNRLIFSNQQRELEYIEAYNTWLNNEGSEDREPAFEALNSELDGHYWK